jgi:RimJ/RimL family protein N-acetyltransferase
VEGVRIETPRFFLRSLVAEDATERYATWLAEASAQRFIAAARGAPDLEALKGYIVQRIGRPDVLFLGIFLRENALHIGNIKYEPVDAEQGYAVMGILIGDPDWRGKGVATEVIEASALWLQANRGIAEIVLGVARDNAAAIRAYLSAGFQMEKTDRITMDPQVNLSMVRRLHPSA